MANNYESTVMLDSYEVSVWNDVYDNTTHRFTEEKIAVIGSNTMTTQFRVLDPTLTENTNGTKTLTFSIYYRYIDHLDGIEKINPFIKLLIVERKIKLHWKDEWYDFIIKQRVESSDKHSFIYTCESLAANELTKTGYHLEFDTELSNNTDTIWNLAQTVLEGTDWRIAEDGGKNFRETVTEAGYKVAPSPTTNLGSYILLFYNTVFLAQNAANNTTNVMFQAWVGDLTDVDDKGTLRTGTCLTDANATFSKSGSNITFSFKDSSNVSHTCTYQGTQQVYDYRAKRDILQQLTLYSPPLKRYVGKYKYTGSNISNPTVRTNDTILGYTTASYVAPDTVTNLIINSENFSNTNGWYNADTFTIHPLYDQNTVVNDYHPKGYLLDKKQHLGNNCFLHNLSYLADGLPKNLKLRVKLNLYQANYDSSKGIYTITDSKTNLPSEVIAQIREYTYDDGSQSYIPGTAYGSITLRKPTDSASNHTYSNVITVSTTLTHNDILTKRIALFFNFGTAAATNTAYAIEKVECYVQKFGPNGQELTPNSINTTSVITYTTKYFALQDNDILKTEDDINWLYVGTSNTSEQLTKWDLATPLYDETCEKIRTITGKNSTRYNWLQTLAETFEVWCKFWVEHDADGRILYDGEGKPQKYVTFVDRVGNFVNYGFVYGIDLKSIQRTIDSNNIATKIIVPQNSNEFAPNGFCTIQRSDENYSKENYVLNFDYYCDNGLIDRGRLYTDLYQAYDSNQPYNLAYIQRLHALNVEYDTRAEQINALENDLEKQQAYLNLYSDARDSANNEINRYKSLIMMLIADDSNGQVTGYDAAVVKAFMDAHADDPWQELVDYYNGLTYAEQQATLYNGLVTSLEASTQAIITQLEGTENVSGLYDEQEINRNNREEIIGDFNKRYSRYVQEGTWQSDDYTDDTKYYLDAQAVAYTSARPKLTYNIQVIRLSALEDYKAKKFKLGDISWVEDEEFFMAHYREEVVVTQVVSHMDMPENDSITVQNYRTEFQDLFQRTESTIHSFQYGEGSYERAASIVNTDGTINAMTLANSIAANNFLMSQSNLNNSITTGPDGITVTDLSDIAKKLRITANGLFITTDGGNNWINAIRGDGISTDALSAGVISTQDIVIDGGQGNTFRWDKKGISAYYFSAENQIINTAHYLRLDRFGVYGVVNDAEFSATSEEDVFNQASFGMTWNRFFMKNRGGNHYIEISSTNDIRVVRTQASPQQEFEQIKIGKLGDNPEVFGIRISDANGIPVMETVSDGTLWLKNILYVGTTVNSYLVRIGYLPLVGEGGQITWVEQELNENNELVNSTTINLDTRLIPNTQEIAHRTIDVNNKFVVWEDGTLYARDGYFQGTIYAENGYFSGTVYANGGQIGDMTIGEINAIPGIIADLEGDFDKVKGISIETQSGTDFIIEDSGTVTPSVIALNALATGFDANVNDYHWFKSADLSTWTALSSGDGAVGSTYTATYSQISSFPYYIKATYGSDTYIDYITLNEIKSGESPITLQIISSTGTIFINNNIYTTLTATVYKGAQDITSQYSNQFYWYKDGTAFDPSNHSNSITVTNSDVNQKAVFVCTVGTNT